jgi:hypothetical protein
LSGHLEVPSSSTFGLSALAPRNARSIDVAIGERELGRILLGARGQRLDRYAATRIGKRLARAAGIAPR